MMPNYYNEIKIIKHEIRKKNISFYIDIFGLKNKPDGDNFKSF